MSKASKKKIIRETSDTGKRNTPKRAALGRGLSTMLARNQQQDVEDKASLKELPVEFIRPGQYQPRSVMDPERLEELAESIKAQGIVQPVIVRHIDGKVPYELIAGERRWRAAQLAGLREIPAVIRHSDDETTLAMSLIENIQREDLNALEEANALKRLIAEFEMTHQQAAEAVGRSRVAVSNLLRLLELEQSVQVLVEQKQLDMGHARALLALSADKQFETAQQVINKQLSVRATEKLVAEILKPADLEPLPMKAQDPNINRLEQQLGEQLGALVKLKQTGKDRGQIVINYHSLDELDGLLERFGMSE